MIHWFRQDLRLSDNPALFHAAQQGSVLPIYLWDEVNGQQKPLGGASRCWLHHSLHALNQQLDDHLLVQSGDPLVLLPQLIKQYKIDAVYWNRCYEPWQIKRDKQLKAELQALGVTVNTFNGSLLWEPWEIEKKDGGNYKVFTPFYRKGCLQAMPPRKPLNKPSRLHMVKVESASLIDSLKLLDGRTWSTQVMAHWAVGEVSAQQVLQHFIKKGLNDYQQGRDFPAKQKVSRLSPHLHWGELSPNQAWYAVRPLPKDSNADCFLSELAWREFSYSLLYYYPTLSRKNLQPKFDRFPWRRNKKLLHAWQRGMTGYPLVDAGMRELWQTGYMHNRVRMVVASFLVKNLNIHWHEGEQWFWDCLVDADLASNSASWQWVAGCGADAAPFFRVFNPVTQAKKFDPHGDYIRHYVPELAHLTDRQLLTPWEVGVNAYPEPIVDLSISRQQALAAYQSIK